MLGGSFYRARSAITDLLPASLLSLSAQAAGTHCETSGRGKPADLPQLSPLESVSAPVEETFEQWVTNRFGKRLFETFFKTYTEKVWGIPCSELKAEWAAQRIKGLSLKTAVLNMFRRPDKTHHDADRSFSLPAARTGT